MTKKTIPSKPGRDKPKTQSPTIHSSISSSQSQKKPLAPSPSRDIKSGGSQPARTVPEIPSITRRPVPMQPVPGQIGGVAGAAYVRGLHTIDMAAMKEIVLSWFLTPVVAGIVFFLLYKVFSFILKVH